ncbi:MAG: hypothetical protein SPL45_02030 [Schwartzia succinivorans]|nr:hypothetical protein [Schwartzia succinivorans]
MAWSISFSERAKADFAKFDTGERTQITKVLKRVSQNPLPKREGGYGTELGKKHGINLSG